MAKKKGKKSSLTSVGVLTAMASALLAVVAICMMFVPAATVNDTNMTYTGLQLTFGYREDTLLGTVTVLNFSFLNFLPYLLALAGIAFSVLTALGKLGKIAPIIATVCYLAAGVLFFLVITMCVPNSCCHLYTSPSPRYRPESCLPASGLKELKVIPVVYIHLLPDDNTRKIV